MNNIGVGFVLAGVLQPALAVARAAEAFGFRDVITTVAFGVLGVISAVAAQLISRRIED